MKRAHSQVAREMFETMETLQGIARDEAMSGYGSHPLHQFHELFIKRLQKWILALAPPKKKRPRDPRTRSERRASVRELDALCREVVFLRDGNKCRKCGRTNGLLDWAHVYSRRFKVTRWALLGSMVLCRGCHLWWHQSPTEAVAWWREQIGHESAKKLELMKRSAKCGPLELVKASLEQEKRRLGG